MQSPRPTRPRQLTRLFLGGDFEEIPFVFVVEVLPFLIPAIHHHLHRAANNLISLNSLKTQLKILTSRLYYYPVEGTTIRIHTVLSILNSIGLYPSLLLSSHCRRKRSYQPELRKII